MPVRVIAPDFIAQSLAGGVAAAWPGAEVVAIGADGRLAGSAEGAVALFRYFPNDRFASSFKGERIDELIDALPSLRLVQSHSVGVDGLLPPRLRGRNVVVWSAAPETNVFEPTMWNPSGACSYVVVIADSREPAPRSLIATA